MKTIILSLFIFCGGAFTASAQTKTAESTLSAPSGYGKYMDVEPLSLEMSNNKKKMKLQRNQNRLNPASSPTQNVITENRQRKPTRVEGELIAEER